MQSEQHEGRHQLVALEDELGTAIDAFLAAHPGAEWSTVRRALWDVQKAVERSEEQGTTAPARD